MTKKVSVEIVTHHGKRRENVEKKEAKTEIEKK